ncbi:hypothetical protein D3C78_866010 [compost metagenome]
MGFTLVTPATETDPELREPFIACRRTRTLYDLMPTAQDWPAHPPVPGAPGGATLGPVWNDGNFLLADEGEVVLHNRPFDPFPGYPASLPYRVEKRDLTTAETVENEKLVVIGTTGNEVVMQTGDYYPDFDWGPEIAARKEKTTSTKTQFYPDRVDRGVPVCNYAPGVIAVVVIPRAQCPQPRPNWPWQNPHISPMPASPTPDLYSYSAVGASQEAYDAWKAENDANRQQVSEPDTPAPHPQSRYLALCDIRTGALLGVSTNPIHTSTARQDTPTSKHRRASIALSCVEQGARDSGTGEITRHGVVLISVRLPPKKDSFDYTEMGTTYVTLTADGGATMRSIVENAFAVPAHYLGTPMAPAKIGVTTGVAGVRGKQVMPPA